MALEWIQLKRDGETIYVTHLDNGHALGIDSKPYGKRGRRFQLAHGFPDGTIGGDWRRVSLGWSSRLKDVKAIAEDHFKRCTPRDIIVDGKIVDRTC